MEKVKACPICGAMPVFEKESMDYGHGHGYPGHYTMTVKCPLCGAPKKVSVDDIYYDGDLYSKAVSVWNKQVNKLESFMKNKNK